MLRVPKNVRNSYTYLKRTETIRLQKKRTDIVHVLKKYGNRTAIVRVHKKTYGKQKPTLKRTEIVRI